MNIKVKKRNFLKKKKVKELKKELGEYSDILADSKNVEILEAEPYSFILVDGEPYIIIIDDKPFPTLKAALANEINGKTVVVDMGAIRFVSNGADIMSPGIVEADSDIEEGDIVLIVDETHKKPLAIGVSLITGDEMVENDSGKAIETKHYVGDSIWNFEVWKVDKMAQLRYEAGRINNPNVHKVGIIALGSHLENHGPALPIDTDAKIGSYIALQSALESGAKFLGVVFPAHELDEIDHGIHVSLEELKKNLIETLKSAKKYLDIEKVVIVNSHGGNTPIMAELADVEDETDITIIFNNKVISTEGPHGGSGELSMGKVLGILNEDEVDNQTDLEKYEEVGLHGFNKARENDPGIEEGARDVEENGVYVDEVYGKQLFELAINSVILDVQKLLDF